LASRKRPDFIFGLFILPKKFSEGQNTQIPFFTFRRKHPDSEFGEFSFFTRGRIWGDSEFTQFSKWRI
jgi:hypothetical protein